MKTISIKQPWAWLIVNGYKDVENRDWKTPYRGPFLIHASKMIDHAGYQYVREVFPELLDELPPPNLIQTGGIVGEAIITDVVTKHLSLWFMGKYGWLLENARPLPFKPAKGQLGFFSFSYGEGR